MDKMDSDSEMGDSKHLGPQSKRFGSQQQYDIVIYQKHTPTSLVHVILKSFPSIVWLQEKGSCSQKGDSTETQTSLVNDGLFGVYAQIKDDNIDLQKAMFPKKEIATTEHARLLSMLDFRQCTMKMEILEPIVPRGKRIP